MLRVMETGSDKPPRLPTRCSGWKPIAEVADTLAEGWRALIKLDEEMMRSRRLIQHLRPPYSLQRPPGLRKGAGKNPRA